MSARDVIAKAIRETSHVSLSLSLSDAILSALEAAGYAVVPKEPTTEMYFAFYSPDSPAVESVQSLWMRRYKAMLTAAKETP